MRRTYRNSLWIFTVLCLAISSHASEKTFSHKPWNALLRHNVVEIRGGKSTQVDYRSFSKESRRLKKYLDSLSAVALADFERWHKDEQLAFLINSYNAFTIQMILSSDKKIKSIKDLGGFFSSPWKKQFIPLFGKKVSLDYIEHQLIRGAGRFNEPRIHFAVNCASIGCPALRNEAYVASKLDQQLEEQTTTFLQDETRNALVKSTLEVSSIFKWYRKDFEQGWRGAYSLSQFLSLYEQSLGLNEREKEKLRSGELKIKFNRYDWRLNGPL